MREIKFRGKTYSGDWKYGFLVIMKNTFDHYIYTGLTEQDYSPEKFRIVPESVGQYAELKDKNGKEIYEGDIVKCNDNFQGQGEYIEVKYDTKYGLFQPFGQNDWSVPSNECEVLGNIYENPELLEKE